MTLSAEQQVTQRETALALANQIRTERANLRKKVAKLPREKGSRLVARYINDPPRSLTTVKLSTMITWIRGVGRIRRKRFLKSILIARPDAELQELTDPERRRVVSALRQGISKS
jgi:hypothetical protein